jgi:hypothetical protein
VVKPATGLRFGNRLRFLIPAVAVPRRAFAAPMNYPSRSSIAIVVVALLVALGFLTGVTRGRIERVEYVTSLGAETALPDPQSPTGWAGNRRWLVAPEHNNDSYQWIMETQRMLATGEWRLRRVNFDTAPDDRGVLPASPYRWWLAGVAKIRQWSTGQPLPLAVERAALHADPVLLGLLVVAGTLAVAGLFGPWPAAAFALGAAALYPFSAAFIPGAPDALGLSLTCGLASVLLVVAAIGFPSGGPTGVRATAAMAVAAVWGGLGVWVSPFVQIPLLAAVAGGGLASAWIWRGADDAMAPRRWRIWGGVGALTSLAAWAIEYLPDNFGWLPQGNHPAVALAWWGGGELVATVAAFRVSSKPLAGWVGRIRAGVALLAVAALPWLFVRAEVPWLHGRDVFGTRLTSLPLAAAATDGWAWLKDSGTRSQQFAVMLPLFWVGAGAWFCVRRRTPARARAALLIALTVVVVTVPLAWAQLRWWSVVDVGMLGLFVAVTAVLANEGRRTAAGLTLAAGVATLIPAIVCQWPAPRAKYEGALTSFEAEGLVERNLAHWLADHAVSPPVVLAPPFRTTALCFHGGFRGIGSLSVANKDAMNAAARIAGATTPDEALALVGKRGVTHIVMPTWDDYLEEYARIFTSRPEHTFAYALKQWTLPPWLRPVAFQLLAVGGFENQSVFLFEVGEEQDQATTLSRLTEYFIEMGQGPLARSTAEGLARYPGNLPALVARAQLYQAAGDQAGIERALAAVLAVYETSEEHDLAWDRRVSLAILLMQGRRTDFARREMEICLNLMDEGRLRTLSVSSLYRFQVLLKALKLPVPDPKLEQLGRELLPESLRGRL